jgi:glucosylceramidase
MKTWLSQPLVSFRSNHLSCMLCRHTSIWILCLFILVLPDYAQQISVFVTSKAGDRLASKPTLHFHSAVHNLKTAIWIDDSMTYQKIDGFGASFLEAGAICLHSLDPAAQETVLQALFDARKGAGFSAMKTVIGATDFMSAGPYYTYDDTPGDLNLLQFSIARDLHPPGLIPYIKRSRRYGTFALQAPMDYPPDWMLFDVKKNQGVNPKYCPVLARYYLRYLQEYEKQGIFIDYLSPFNEPGIYTKIPAQNIRDLIRSNLGPLFRQAAVKTRIQVCDFGNRKDAWRDLPIILGDPQTRQYVGGISYHGYEFKDQDKIAKIHDQYPRLPIWMTEVDHSYGTDTPRSKPLPRYDYEDGNFWGNQIISDLESGTSAWIYWNMILDERGGPYLLSEIHRDGPDNFQHPVVIINRQTKQVTYTALYYYLAHFSKFVRPGAHRIQSYGRVHGIRAIAFNRPDEAIVLELLNSSFRSVKAELGWRKRSVMVELSALSISTLVWRRYGNEVSVRAIHHHRRASASCGPRHLRLGLE